MATYTMYQHRILCESRCWPRDIGRLIASYAELDDRDRLLFLLMEISSGRLIISKTVPKLANYRFEFRISWLPRYVVGSAAKCARMRELATCSYVIEFIGIPFVRTVSFDTLLHGLQKCILNRVATGDYGYGWQANRRAVGYCITNHFRQLMARF